MFNNNLKLMADLLVCLMALVVTATPAIASQKRAAQTSRTVSIPFTPAGSQFARWLRVFNSGDAVEIRRFISEDFAEAALKQRSIEDRLESQLIHFYDTRGYDFRFIEKSTPQEFTGLVQSKLTGLWYRITIKVESKVEPGPYKITEFNRDLVPRLVGAGAASKSPATQLLPELDALMRKLVAADAFSGAVLVAKNRKPIFAKAYGKASVTYNSLNRPDTKFNLASLNKMFTAVAIAQLAEQGKLAFDDPIAKLLPDYPNKQVAEKVTVHQLLTHTSGMGSYFGEKLIDERTKFVKVQDYFSLFVNEPLAFEPGKDWQYSNSGYIVLGAIIEKVSGEDYFDYVSKHIFKPAGMLNTDSYELDRDVPNVATGYTNADRKFQFQLKERRNTLIFQGFKGSPAGGGYSTVGDLLRFSVALREHKLLNAKNVELVTVGKVKGGRPGEMYGYGFEVATVNGERIVGHSGGALGANAFFDMYLDSGYTVVVLSNYDRGGNLVVAKLRELITRSHK
jgi:CubicO group peptidase (beta-lactamase class C family)